MLLLAKRVDTLEEGRALLKENIDNGNAGSEVQALFEIYCAM